jgi:hypothetical protein
MSAKDAYFHRCTALILFRAKLHPNGLGGAKVEVFLTGLASERQAVLATLKKQTFRLTKRCRRIGPVGRFAEVKGEAAALGCAGVREPGHRQSIRTVCV